MSLKAVGFIETDMQPQKKLILKSLPLRHCRHQHTVMSLQSHALLSPIDSANYCFVSATISKPHIKAGFTYVS